MSNIVEPPYYGGIYQLETVDDIMGGAGGLANQQSVQLGGRTKWMLAASDILGLSPITNGAVLAVADAGKLFYTDSTSNVTSFLPDLSAMAALTVTPIVYTYANIGQAFLNVNGNGQSILSLNGSAFTIALRPGETIRFMAYFNSGVGAWAWSAMQVSSYQNVPIGALMDYPGPYSASTLRGWLPCNGSAISRSAYVDLFNRIGTTYGAGNGVTTFNLPDYRGEFRRGNDNGRGVDVGRVAFSQQLDDIKSHSHPSTTANGFLEYGTSATNDGYLAFGASNQLPVRYITSTDPFGGSETRPRNRGVEVLIKY